ncbi:putative lipid II flippase FtsW [Desulfatibacillum aliphaticivorans]|uniref:putative lipid II flippase FtsW n=1 Tax=Desulfatibacillum aliphaticivorans TaxID=218208 RepID=UPI00200A110C|nr:putative lipid II flippase FtsW [Desulfatibacillum aliphaticivorans]
MMPEKTAKKNQGAFDKVILVAVLGLIGMGLVMVYSASSAMAVKTYGSDTYFFKRQLFFALTGLVLLFSVRYIPYRVYQVLAYPILGLSVLLLGLLLVPGIGVNVGGATRWMRVGPINIQPAEIMRLAIIIYMAYSLTKKGEKMKDFSVGIIPHLFLMGLIGGLFYFQPDFGSFAMLVFVIGIMLFVGGAHIGHLSGLVALAGLVGFKLLMSEGYRRNRIAAFLNPWENQMGDGYQITHSLMAFGTGGYSGVGVGNGYQKLFYLPEPHTDFIFSVLGEEMGLIGVGIVVGLFALLVWRGLTIAQRAPAGFARLLAFGITASIGLQACLNMAVTTNLLPTKGLALPFISYGGSSLLINMVSIGILENIAYAHPASPGARAPFFGRLVFWKRRAVA